MYEPGTVVAGKYRVEKLLGRGGMGVVLAAEHLELRVPVALKFLSDRYSTRTDIIMRFLREARAAAQLKSAHVCRVFDVGRLDDGLPFIVMERLVGQDLAKLLRAEGQLAVPTAADYIAQACDAVAEAHDAGIVHRDLKPGNLFLTQNRDGSALLKVLDFGVAKLHTEEDHDITNSQTVVGSPTYMAPEQLRSARGADARSDIWSLGVILHQLVTGNTPFRGETIADLAIRAAIDPLPSLEHLPPAYAAIIARCLEKQPDRRFQTATELAAELAPLASRPSRPPTITPSPQLEVMLGPNTADPSAPTETTLRGAASVTTGMPRAKKPPRALVIGAVAAIAIGAGAGLFVNRGSTPARPAAPVDVVRMPTAAPVSIDAGVAATVVVVDAAEIVAAPPPLDAAVPAAAIVAPVHVAKPPVHHKTKEQIGASRY
ncbi:MAG TPA: serine/threonine-protein kinase [Kofleriaceae bacterium]